MNSFKWEVRGWWISPLNSRWLCYLGTAVNKVCSAIVRYVEPDTAHAEILKWALLLWKLISFSAWWSSLSFTLSSRRTPGRYDDETAGVSATPDGLLCLSGSASLRGLLFNDHCSAEIRQQRFCLLSRFSLFLPGSFYLSAALFSGVGERLGELVRLCAPLWWV